MFVRSTGSAWGCSTLVLPNAATANQIVRATATNTYGGDSGLTFDGVTFSTLAGLFTSVTNAALTAGRVTLAGTGGLLSDDADLTFATDTLTATKVIAPTSATTPVVYGAGTPKSLGLGGSGINGCSTNPPSTANCEAGVFTFNAAILEQRYATDNTYRSQWFVNETGARLRGFTTNDFIPLTIQGAPIRLGGGGVHFGELASVSDPGLGNAYVDGWFRSTSPAYASQTSGMALDFTTGSIDAQYIYANEMHVKNFIADLEQALAGSQIISKSVAVVSRDFTVPSGGSIATLYVRDLPSAANMAVFESGDTIRLRQFSRASGSLSVTDAYGVVTSYSDLTDGEQSWTFTRSLSPCSGAMSTGTVIAADSLALDYGVSENGFIETNAIDGVYGINSPYTQAVTWSGCASTQTVRTRVGNLRGIGPGTWGYGLFAGDYANGRYAVFSDQTVELHNVPFTMYNGTTPVIELSPTVPSFKMGTNTESVSSSAGSGMWSGLSGGCFLWRVGNPAAQGISFNSCSGTLTVTGDIIVSGTIPDADNALALGGIAAAVYEGVKDKVDAGLSATGNPTLPAVATPSGSGLYMGSDFMGYYASGAWKTFMQSNGNFYLGGTGGNLQWVASTSTLTISATLSGNGSAITSISGGNITTGSVTATQIAANTITASQIAADTITASQIAANAITTSELAADSVTSAKIVAGTIVASDIATGTITANEIAAGTITATQIATGTITATQIASNTITASLIAAGTITSDKLAVTDLSAISASLGSVTINTGGKLATDNFELSAEYGLLFENAADENSYANMVHWKSGGRVGGNNDRTWLWGPNGDMAVAIYSPFIDFQSGGGSPTSRASIHANGEFWVGSGESGGTGWLYLKDVSSTTDDDYPLIVGASREVRYKTNGLSGWLGCSYVGDIYVERGIVTDKSCASLESLGLATRSEVDVLRSEIAELRALVFSLTGGRK
jgi:hypothetical protein